MGKRDRNDFGESQSHGESRSRARWFIQSGLLGLAILSTIGAAVPWLTRSSEGESRKLTLRSFSEDFQGSRKYPVYRACRLVHSLTEHRVDRRIEPWENWIQWSLGQLYAPVLRTQDPDLILEKGQGDCSERVAVLQSLFHLSHLPTRIVGLGGHVVLEVQANGKWYTADPDYGVLHLGTVEQLSRASDNPFGPPLWRAGYSAETIDLYTELFRSEMDNTAMPLNSPISPRLYWIERFSSILMVALPCVFWLLTFVASSLFHRISLN